MQMSEQVCQQGPTFLGGQGTRCEKKESKDKANSSRSLPSSDPDFPVLVPPLLAPWAPGSSW